MSNQDTFKKGSVELLVLALLQESNLYGYQISQLVKERSGNILTIPEGSMYPTFHLELIWGTPINFAFLR